MNEELNQKISEFLDDELDHDQSLSLLEKMRSQPELSTTLNRYQAISHALKTDVFLSVRPDFSELISQQIENEPVYLLPRKKSIKLHYKKYALAASIALVAVLVGRGLNNNHAATPFNNPSALQVAQQQLPKQTSKPVTSPVKQKQPTLNARINDYLQAHNSSVYTNGEADLSSLTRVTGYSQE